VTLLGDPALAGTAASRSSVRGDARRANPGRDTHASMRALAKRHGLRYYNNQNDMLPIVFHGLGLTPAQREWKNRPADAGQNLSRERAPLIKHERPRKHRHRDLPRRRLDQWRVATRSTAHQGAGNATPGLAIGPRFDATL
jgi:hypothetical protein